MTSIHRAALLAAWAAASMPVVAAGQATSADSLLRRIELLERANTGLDQRVRALEALIAVEPSRAQPVPESAKWQNLANWRRLRRGMTMDEVRALLGEPERVDANAWNTFWYWASPGGPDVYFDSQSSKLDGWSEPIFAAQRPEVEVVVDEKPVLLSGPKLHYPKLLKDAGVQGRVLVHAIIDTSGHAEPPSVKVIQSPNPGFDPEAKEYVLKALFRPGRLHGRPVRAPVEMTVDFYIK